MNNAISSRINKTNAIDKATNEQVNIFQAALQPLLETGRENEVIGLSWETLRSGVKAINNGAMASEILAHFEIA